MVDFPVPEGAEKTTSFPCCFCSSVITILLYILQLLPYLLKLFLDMDDLLGDFSTL